MSEKFLYPKIAYDWGAFLLDCIEEYGTLEKAAAQIAPMNEQTEAKRRLRRLRTLSHYHSGPWGQKALEFFGLPPDVTSRLRWMGQWHSRFHDLPGSICIEMLDLWNRPPMSQSPVGRTWIELGFTWVASDTTTLRRPAPIFSRSIRSWTPPVGSESRRPCSSLGWIGRMLRTIEQVNGWRS